MIITGTVFNSDKKTPAADAVIYVYHTNSKGIYPKRGDEKGNGRRHGYLRAWMKTNEKGKFQFTTIRPGSYPNSTEPAHIHMTIKPEGKEEYYLTTLTFSDDPLATEKKTRNGDVLTLTKNEKGTWIGEYSAVLRD